MPRKNRTKKVVNPEHGSGSDDRLTFKEYQFYCTQVGKKALSEQRVRLSVVAKRYFKSKLAQSYEHYKSSSSVVTEKDLSIGIWKFVTHLNEVLAKKTQSQLMGRFRIGPGSIVEIIEIPEEKPRGTGSKRKLEPKLGMGYDRRLNRYCVTRSSKDSYKSEVSPKQYDSRKVRKSAKYSVRDSPAGPKLTVSNQVSYKVIPRHETRVLKEGFGEPIKTVIPGKKLRGFRVARPQIEEGDLDQAMVMCKLGLWPFCSPHDDGGQVTAFSPEC